MIHNILAFIVVFISGAIAGVTVMCLCVVISAEEKRKYYKKGERKDEKRKRLDSMQGTTSRE